MGVVLAVLIWILVGILSALMLLVLLPFQAVAGGELAEDHAGVSFEVAWAWGVTRLRVELGQAARLYLFGLRVARFRLGAGKKEKEVEKEKEREEPKKKGRLSPKDLPVLLRMVQRMARPLALSGRLEGTLGTGDPGDTALLVEAIHQIDRLSDRFVAEVRPSYIDPVLDLKGAIRVRIWVAHLGVTALGLLFVRENRQVLRALR